MCFKFLAYNVAAIIVNTEVYLLNVYDIYFKVLAVTNPFMYIFLYMQQEFTNRMSLLTLEYLQQLVALLHTHAPPKKNSLQVLYLFLLP